MAKWIRHWTPNPKIAGSSPAEDELTTIAFVAEWSKALDSSSSLFGGVGSNPTECIIYIALVAQLAERSAVNRQVAGSIPAGSVFFIYFDCFVDKFALMNDIFEQKMPVRGFEPRFSRPQREVLTTRRYELILKPVVGVEPTTLSLQG